jgi:hypothetical protein
MAEAPTNPPQHTYTCDWCGEADHAAKGWKWLKDRGSSAESIALCAPCLKELANGPWKAKQEAA